MRFDVLRVRGVVNLFIKCWWKVGTMWLWFNGQQDLPGNFRLLCISRVEARPGGSAPHGLPYADYHAGVGQVPHKCDKCILNAAARQRTRTSFLAALGTVRGFQP